MGRPAGTVSGVGAGNILARGVAAGSITQAQADRFAAAARQQGVAGTAADLRNAATRFVSTGGRQGGPRAPRRGTRARR